jgi:tRNA(fMet)-specific endonuclease VapC
MGLILDSSVLIAAERKGSNARQALSEIAQRAAGEDVALSVVTLIELAHGAARADTPQRKAMRRQFLNELTAAVPVHPVTVPVALRAGQIDGENTAKGRPSRPRRPVDRGHGVGAWLPYCSRKFASLPDGSGVGNRVLLSERLRG